jgi:plastocyanin
LAVGAASIVLAALPALARTHQASIGNYWYEDDQQHDRTRIVVAAGDQITFTVREGVYPPHSVNVDALNIHSPELLLGETYTTPALRKPGIYRLYCRAHEDRGHFTRLVIQAPRATASPAPATPRASRPPAAGASAAPSPTATVASATPAATLTPVGVGKATKAELAQPIRRDPNSLEALTGRTRSTALWTRSLWWLLIAAVPIVGVAAYALRREAARVSAGTAPSSSGRRRSSGRSPRSSPRKASGPSRTSRGRRR